MWRDKDRGTSMGKTMQSREAALTNSNQRVNMGTSCQLASAEGDLLLAAPLAQLHCGCGVGRPDAVPESQDTAVSPTAAA